MGPTWGPRAGQGLAMSLAMSAGWQLRKLGLCPPTEPGRRGLPFLRIAFQRNGFHLGPGERCPGLQELRSHLTEAEEAFTPASAFQWALRERRDGDLSSRVGWGTQ